MKRVSIFLVIILCNLFVIETVDMNGFESYRPKLEASVVADEYVLSWPQAPRANYYEVEVLLSPPAGQNTPVNPSERITVYRTAQNKMTVKTDFPANTYWRVSAQGLLGQPLGSYSNHLSLSEVMSSEASLTKPRATSSYPAQDPAPAKPILTWTPVPGAVYYEIEFLDAPPEQPNNTAPSIHRIRFSREVYVNGYNADFSDYSAASLYWRVLALDYDGQPLGVYSDAQQIFIDHARQVPLKPPITAVFNENGTATPLYPAYSWIPISGAAKYEVEILSQQPENPNGVEPSVYRIWCKEVTGFDCYDDEPRIIPGTYFWRVRGLDDAGSPVGCFSDTGRFTVDLTKGYYAATFGDSITHGGGAVSYSPADWDYSFQTYLNFPVVNLGKSGDTSATLAARFDSDVLPYHPQYLIILGGTNSLRGGVPAGQVIEDLAAIREKCLAKGIRPIFLTLPPINPAAIARTFNEETSPDWRQQFDAVNAFIRAQRYYIDIDPGMCDLNRELPGYYGIDGLHPDIEGKKLMAQIINANWAKVTR